MLVYVSGLIFGLEITSKLCVLIITTVDFWAIDYRIVKLSSPYVNVMIIAGAIIFYTTVILFGVDENIAPFSFVDGLCQARIWLCVIGFSLLFGTIFAKAWRIYYIFNHLTPNSKTVCGSLNISWLV